MKQLDPKAVQKTCTRFLNGSPPAALQPAAVLKALAESVDAGDGPDNYGVGGLVEAFERQVADLLGKEAAVFLVSGTMAQQIALRIWTQRQRCRNVVFHPLCHLELHEEKAYQRLHGLQAITPGASGDLLRRKTLEGVPDPIGAVLIELPQREIGGVLLPWDQLVDLSAWCREKSIPLHMDGARLWECQPHYQKSYAEISGLFDSVYVSFYKGLGGLSGAILTGSADFVAEARVWRKRHGGALYQLYPYVASARLGLKSRLSRMPQYHQHALEIARQLSSIEGIELTPNPPHTNMMHLYLRGDLDRLQTAAVEVAQESKVWLFNRLLPSLLPGYGRLELTVRDGTLEVMPSQVGELFREVLRKARLSD